MKPRPPEEAPIGKKVLVFTIGGWGIMMKDELGQWRAASGRPKQMPKCWVDMLGSPEELAARQQAIEKWENYAFSEANLAVVGKDELRECLKDIIGAFR